LPRLRYAYADALVEAGRTEDALVWFHRAAGADADGSTGAAERAAELEGLQFTDLDDEGDYADASEDDDETPVDLADEEDVLEDDVLEDDDLEDDSLDADEDDDLEDDEIEDDQDLQEDDELVVDDALDGELEPSDEVKPGDEVKPDEVKSDEGVKVAEDDLEDEAVDEDEPRR
jgi:hypothetical protein